MGTRGHLLATIAMMAVGGVLAGCAGTRVAPGAPEVAAPVDVAAPPVVAGAGLPTTPAEPWIEGSAAVASAITAPLHAVACMASVAVNGVFYVGYFPSDMSEDFKTLIADTCAGPYFATPADVASVPHQFSIRAMRIPRMGRLPVEEAVRQALPPR
jgi:hypothetical protein